MLQLKTVGEITPKNTIAPGDNLTVSNILYSLGKDVESSRLCDVLNSINNQGITEVDIKHRTYTIHGEVLSLSCLSTSEQLFLLTALAAETGTPLVVYRYDRQLSTRVLKKYITMFRNTNNIILLLDNISTMTYYHWRDICST